MTTLEFSYSLTKLSPSLKPFALKLTRDMDDANDLLQDTMVKAFTNKDKFTDGTNLKAWLYTIMKNTFITNYQRMVRRGTFVDTTENLHFINSGSTIIENGVYGDFAMNDITKAINRLDEVYKSPFLMHYRGFKYHEIAIKLNIPIGTVKNRIHIARKLLKDDLKVYTTIN
ncbi:RNA polymerase sigma factor [Cyclobacterium marinum]|uniref:RNA polymerase, sigma-24 subunit, ECF subfamily n=1 Tax=Cyclobacterium marinum (strain ATCC 25205 / DSM 745 / LMG 13164 / NCIMB 1802) TaxID=880070 RepID=G0IZM1_CYCMS|nr:RNA polymerase sigma factor [Cyclobacterium marinum]AEL25062.1 RNA polymerase, sigma-24 subunit, ECF subfamily [Cyclobacterium marinum DSM 745]MBI0401467.1 RNA polymerase sigma factor [Cyclobacterium marinum]MBR9773615.1 RNA polymerase sigma factor [Cytophagales bacterium]|tara:strand:- start:44476 stop:44988 length:513 start_codon:yes stop_codon:yes gene_type:complete